MARETARNAWVVLARGWPWFLGAVVVDAVVQAVLVRFGFTPRVDPPFLGVLAISVLVAAAALTVIVAAATAAALGQRMRIRRRAVLAVVITVVLSVAAAILHTVLGVVVTVFGMLVLPMLAAPGSLDDALRRLLGLRRAVPHAIGWIVADVALIGLAWLSSFHTAFFVAGAYAAVLSWTTTGLAVVMMQCGSASLLARVTRRMPSPESVGPPWARSR